MADDSRSAGEYLRQLPSELKPRLIEGLRVLKTVDLSKIDLVEWAIQNVGESQPPDFSALDKNLSISSDNARSLGFAVMFLLGLSNLETDAPTTAKIALEEGFFSADCSGNCEALLSAFKSQKDRIGKLTAVVRLANELLPSLDAFETTVDVRLGFDRESGRATIATPVVLLFVDTDTEGHRLWCQATPKQLRSIMKQLESTLQMVKEAERISASAVSGG